MSFELKGVFGLSLVLIGATFSSCAHSPRTPVLKQEEIAHREQLVVSEVVNQIENNLHFEKDAELKSYLQTIGRKVLGCSGRACNQPLQISLIRANPDGIKSYALPQNHLYLSVDLLKKLNFENEIAAEIAVQLAHIQKRHIYSRLNLISDQSPIENFESHKIFGEEGLFAYSSDQLLAAYMSAVDTLYSVGYDPRGILPLLDFLKENSNKYFLVKDKVDKIIFEVRSRIALYAPLRNPIVQTSQFIAMQKRIQDL